MDETSEDGAETGGVPSQAGRRERERGERGGEVSEGGWRGRVGGEVGLSGGGVLVLREEDGKEER